MKRFACGDVVPGCQATWEAETDGDILTLVADHARTDHGMADVSPELVSAVRAHITSTDD